MSNNLLITKVSSINICNEDEFKGHDETYKEVNVIEQLVKRVGKIEGIFNEINRNNVIPVSSYRDQSQHYVENNSNFKKNHDKKKIVSQGKFKVKDKTLIISNLTQRNY